MCYADESGYNGKKFNPKQPVQTMVGIFPNLYNFHRSDSEFKTVFSIIKKKIPISEIKAQQIYRKKKCWASVEPEIRDRVIDYYFDWIKKRNHKFIVVAVDNKKFFSLRNKHPKNKILKAIEYPYIFSGIHLALVVQKINRNLRKNKGKTILIFDEQKDFSNSLPKIIFDPPNFIDEFVSFDQRKEGARLSQIVDTAFFVHSHHSSMAQLVDIVAYFYRLYLELNFYKIPEAYCGEKQKINNWIDSIKDKFIDSSKVYPKGKHGFLKFIHTVKAHGM